MHQGLKTVRMSPTGSLPTAHTTPHQHQKVANRCRFHPLTLTHSLSVVYYTMMKNVLEMFVLCPAYDRNPGRSSRDALILHPVSCICDLVDAFVDSTSSSKLRAEAPPARDTAYPSIQRDEAQWACALGWFSYGCGGFIRKFDRQGECTSFQHIHATCTSIVSS